MLYGKLKREVVKRVLTKRGWQSFGCHHSTIGSENFMLLFIKRNLWGLLLMPCFISSLILSFSANSNTLIILGILASCGTGIAALICFIHPFEPKPFRKVYSHSDWDTGDGFAFPTLTIPASDHCMGLTPHLEFRQGDYVFPWAFEPNGDIVITRDNHSIPFFADLGVIVRRKSI